MSTSKVDHECQINILLEEYRILESKKRTTEQGQAAIGTFLALGTATVVVAAWDINQREALVALLPAQLSLFALLNGQSMMSNRYDMYIAIIEQRINEIAGSKLLNWENWEVHHPIGFRLRELHHVVFQPHKSPLSVVSAAVMVTLGVLLLSEFGYSIYLLWRWELLNEHNYLSLTIVIGYALVNALLIFYLGIAWIKHYDWSLGQYQLFRTALLRSEDEPPPSSHWWQFWERS